MTFRIFLFVLIALAIFAIVIRAHIRYGRENGERDKLLGSNDKSRKHMRKEYERNLGILKGLFSSCEAKCNAAEWLYRFIADSQMGELSEMDYSEYLMLKNENATCVMEVKKPMVFVQCLSLDTLEQNNRIRVEMVCSRDGVISLSDIRSNDRPTAVRVVRLDRPHDPTDTGSFAIC